MDVLKKNIKRIVPTILLILGIIGAFWHFIRDNARRIALQNEEYLSELTIQRASSIDNLVEENLNYIQSTAYLYSKNLSATGIDVDVLREYEENSVFDLLRFVDASGDDYTSQGLMANLADRDYFRDGMQGGEGVTYVLHSKVTGERQIGFYAPVRYDDEIIGIMVGFYGEDYIRELMEYELFGYNGIGWLCTADGTVLGTTQDDEPDNYLSYLQENELCEPEELALLQKAFAAGDNVTFTIKEGETATTAYAVALENTDWFLIRSFPASASAAILENANREGGMLVIELLLLFVIYGVFMGVGIVIDHNKIKEQARDTGYISSGVSTLFNKFVTLDLHAGEYRYIGDVPDDPGLPTQGKYSHYEVSLLGRIEDEKQRDEARSFLSIHHLRKILTNTDRTSIRIHAPIGDGEWYTYNFIVIEREEGEPVRLLIVAQDVTSLYLKEKEEQNQLQEALDHAERASQAKTEFLFNMSHDLRTPMNAIIGYTKLAQGDQVSQTQMLDYIRKIDSSSNHLLALINDILEMSRIESGKLIIEPESTDLVQVMDEARELFETQMQTKGIRYTVDASGVRHRWVLCDKNRLNRIILNLLSNAYKFTPAGGSVQATLRQLEAEAQNGNEWFELRIKDSGIGMSEAFVQKLFMPFERERTSTVSGIQGTGLGMSITKRIVDLMGGSIRVNTRQGEGSEFIVTLPFPLDEAHSTQTSLPDADARELDFSRVRLLLVEDNAINREIATMILTQAGFMLETAENGREALDRLQAAGVGYFDAVLMDIQMPVMDGYTATKEIRALEQEALARIPIIAMTANAFQEDVQAARDAGMDAHIAKPLDVAVMMDTLRRVLQQADVL